MNKEPIGLYIFRLMLGFGLLIFMLMLYWSSTLIEEDIKGLRGDIGQLKNDLQIIRTNTEKLHANSLDPNSNPSSPSSDSSGTPKTSISTSLTLNRPQIDPNLPNLLQDDPFYNVTLPALLGPDFKPLGTFHNAVLGKPDNLHPFSNWSQVSTWVSQCTVSVSKQKVGIYESFAPDMAIKVEERKNTKTGKDEFWIHLRDRVYWQPLRSQWFSEDINLAPQFFQKHQVTADDFKFYFDAVMNPFVQDMGAISLRNYLEDIDSIEVIDKLTFIVRWKGKEIKESDGTVTYKNKYVARMWTGSLRPFPRFVYQYFADGSKIVEDDSSPETYRTNSTWAQNFEQHWAKNIIVSCGPWIFDGMTDRQIKFKRNPDHYFPLETLVGASEIQFKDSPDSIWQEFKSNHLDSYEIRPDQILEYKDFQKTPQHSEQEKNGAAIRQLEYVTRAYAYIGWNEGKPYFNSKKVRQALTMAIDRRRIIQQNLNGLGVEITGTFYRYSPAYDTSIQPWPYDLLKARRLLEEEGWIDRDGDGIIDKSVDGKNTPFRFRLTYYVKNPASKSICEYVSTALKEVGIDCVLHGVDIADLSAVFEEKSFDAINLAWVLGTPPEDPKQLWYSAGAKEKGSSNAIGFSNPEIDKIIEDLEYESDPKKRIALYHRFDAIIHEEAPYTFLYTPKTIMLYREYLQNVFIPAEKQDLIPDANVAQPDSAIFWLKPH